MFALQSQRLEYFQSFIYAIETLIQSDIQNEDISKAVMDRVRELTFVFFHLRNSEGFNDNKLQIQFAPDQKDPKYISRILKNSLISNLRKQKINLFNSLQEEKGLALYQRHGLFLIEILRVLDQIESEDVMKFFYISDLLKIGRSMSFSSSLEHVTKTFLKQYTPRSFTYGIKHFEEL